MPGIARQVSSYARRAAATATSIVAASAVGTSNSVSSVDGLIDANQSLPSTNAPSM